VSSDPVFNQNSTVTPLSKFVFRFVSRVAVTGPIVPVTVWSKIFDLESNTSAKDDVPSDEPKTEFGPPLMLIYS